VTDRLLADAPHDYYADDKPAAPSQVRAILAVACDLLCVEYPTTRLEASVLLARLIVAHGELPADERPGVDLPW